MARLSDTIAARLERERGTIYGHGRRAVAMVYPSPYPIGMSSLGFQAVYKTINSLPDTVAERAFAPDADQTDATPLLTYESRRPAADFGIVAFSVAYELELGGMFTCLKAMGLPAGRERRGPADPLIVAGGPLTFSNPVPLAPFVDVIVMGEGEQVIEAVVDGAYKIADRAELLKHLAQVPGLYVPAHHGDELRPVAKAADECLPATSAIVTPEATLSDMFLVEAERGCSRACSFCVMRRSTNGGMRLADPDAILNSIPEYAKRVGLVGAAVSDHPRIYEIVDRIVAGGREVGLSSLRADRLTPEFVGALARGGYRTLTVASDGASEALRVGLMKKIRGRHLIRAAELARDAELKQLKVYMMIGVPDETDADIDELAEFCSEQASVLGPRTRLALGIAPFVAKRNTPLDGAPFVGVREADRRLERLRKSLAKDIDIRPVSSRWAWVEYQLAQGGSRAGLAAYEAWQAGGRFAHYKRAFKSITPGLNPLVQLGQPA